MKKIMALFLLLTFSTSFLISCNDMRAENSFSSDEAPSIVESSLSENKGESLSEPSSEELLPLYTDIMPPLTPEEEAKINDIVPLSVFGVENIKNEETPYSKMFQKNFNELTYGEICRFTNQGYSLHTQIWTTTNLDETFQISSPIYSELKSVKSIYFPTDAKNHNWNSVFQMKNVEKISIGEVSNVDSAFGDMPEGFGNFTNLKKFNSKVSQIYSFPDVFDEFDQLEYFNCSDSYLTEMPPSFYRFPNLKELNLDANPLTLSPEIAQMQSLEVLTLPSIYEYPDELGELKNLKELYIKSSRYTLQEEREDVATRTEIKLTESPKRILLGSVTSVHLPPKYAVLPEGIGELENLEKLECWYVKGPLPESIGNLKNLEGLDLSGEITKLPESIGNLTSLKSLNISEGQRPFQKILAICKTWNIWIFKMKNWKKPHGQ